jgi:protein-tyrosine phosphatase
MMGTDCHGIRHVEALKLARTSKYYRKALASCLNNNL